VHPRASEPGPPVGLLPVVVTAADNPIGLGLARALRGLGFPIYGLAFNPDNPCCRSVAWSDVRAVVGDREQTLVGALLELAERHRLQVLFPTEDDDVEIVARHRELLDPHYRLVLPDHRIVRLLADKADFGVWAEKNGFRIPRTCVVSSAAELDAALAGMSFPVVLKPPVRDQKWTNAGGRKAHYRLNSPVAVADIPFELFDASDRYVVQEWIEGRDDDVHFCLVYRDRAGREVAHQTGRKLVQWPVGTGDTAMCTSTEDPTLHRLTDQVFDRAGMIGLGSVEVKRDRRDGEYYITEPTVGRSELQSNVATAAGLNLAVIAYHDACGRSAETPRRRRNAIWLNERHLVRALVVAALRRQLALVEIGRAVFRCRAVAFTYSGSGDLEPLKAGLLRRLRTSARLLMRRRQG
jgi:D-aspartate ligase